MKLKRSVIYPTLFFIVIIVACQCSINHFEFQPRLRIEFWILIKLFRLNFLKLKWYCFIKKKNQRIATEFLTGFCLVNRVILNFFIYIFSSTRLHSNVGLVRSRIKLDFKTIIYIYISILYWESYEKTLIYELPIATILSWRQIFILFHESN